MTNSDTRQTLPVGQCASLATLIEATSPKPGNVHRGADFEDLTYCDFVAAALVTAPIIERATIQRVGATVLQAVTATRQCVAANTNLGTLLLLVPLASVPRDKPIGAEIRLVLAQLDSDDARNVYEAIRLAQPGGMGKVDDADINNSPPRDLVAAMRLAADRDMVARQYANGFAEVLGEVLPALMHGLDAGWPLPDAVVHAHVSLLAKYGDSLVARKRGIAVSQVAAQRAQRVLDSGLPGDRAYHCELAEFDFWLRSDGHARNPGTTADLIAAGLFCALRDGIIKLPLRLTETLAPPS